MKTFSKCLALVLAVAGAATLAGCNNGTPSRRTATTANWNVRTSTAVEENSFDYWKKNMEVATYKVSFSAGSNTSYEVAYDTDTATYETAFYMSEYDWASENIPERYRTEESVKENVYVYETTLKISGDYKIKSGGDKFHFEDELSTVSIFRPAKNNLQPVYSYQKVKNTSPATLTAGSISSAYVQVDEVYDTYYNRGCSEALVKKSKPESKGSETYVEYDTDVIGLSSDYSNFDNSQLRAAVRAFTLSGGSSRTFYVVAPQNGYIQSVSASISDPVELNPLGTEDHQIISNALKTATENGYLFFDGTIPDKKENEKDRNFRFNAVSLSINESLQGPSSYMWYSTVENNDINGTRCVLLKVGTPLAFGMGTLTYNLKELKLEPIV